MPRCSRGEYSFRVGVVNDGETAIRIKNISDGPLQLERVNAFYGRDETQTNWTEVKFAAGESMTVHFDGSYKPPTDVGVS